MSHALRQFVWLTMALLSASAIWDLAQLAALHLKG